MMNGIARVSWVWAIGLALGCACVAALPSSALACACCDGGASREPLGWSRSGRSLLVRVRRERACERHEFLEVWRAGQASPAFCFDMHGDPNARVDCEAVTDSLDPGVTSSRLRFFPTAPRALPATAVRAQLTRFDPDGERPSGVGDDQDLTDSPAMLTVEVWAGGSWHQVLRRLVNEGKEESTEEANEVHLANLREQIAGHLPHDIRVTVFPAPDHDSAIVRVSGQDTMPGIGYFPDELAWVTLPAGVAEVGPSATYVVAVHGPSELEIGGDAARRYAHRVNRDGLQLLGRGDVEAARGAFAHALFFQPDYAAARYNLACALARGGLAERAMAHLRLLQVSDCADCRRRLARAARDADLASLREREDFRALITPRDAAR